MIRITLKAVMQYSGKHLGQHITDNLTWSTNTASIVKKAHQQLYFLRRFKAAGLDLPALDSFCRCRVERVLTQSFTVWYIS